MDGADLAGMYEDTRARLADILGGLTEEERSVPVPACPGWSVSDTACHLVAVAEDVLAGRLTRPPTDEEAAAGVARLAGTALGDVLARWDELAGPVGEVITAGTVWPLVLDVASHEHDIRGALGRPGARDTEVVRAGSVQLLRWLRPPLPVVVRLEDAVGDVVEVDVPGAPEGGDVGPLRLTTTPFEALRWRLGRRSRRQLAAMAWSGDPAPVLDHLVVFGPASSDLLE